MKKILMTYSDSMERPNDEYGGCGYIRIAQPAKHLAKYFDVHHTAKITDGNETPEVVWGRVFTTYDLMLVEHCDNPVALCQLFGARDFYGSKVIIELDDNFFNVDPLSPSYQYYYPGSDVEHFTKMSLGWANSLIVSTEKLKEIYSPYNDNIFVCPNQIDPEVWEGYKPKQFDDGKIRLGWYGSITHESDFMEIIDVLKAILKKYPNVIFKCMGAESEMFYDLPKEQFEFCVGTGTFREFPGRLAGMGFDIGIAPLKQSTFNQCKSAVKYLEYSMYKIPCVATKGKQLPYARLIHHGKDGFLCNKFADWMSALSRLIESEELRRKIGESAYNNVLAQRDIRKNVVLWADTIDATLTMPLKAPSVSTIIQPEEKRIVVARG